MHRIMQSLDDDIHPIHVDDGLEDRIKPFFYQTGTEDSLLDLSKPKRLLRLLT